MHHNPECDLDIARRVALEAESLGGRVYFVGGYVRDHVMGCESKDIDIEVHGVTPEQLRTILDGIGERTQMGASFGIYGLRHCGLDVAMPRAEGSRGGRDFDDVVSPFIGTHKAARRRDFTINALMQDVLTGELIDHFGGLEDLRAGVIRHVADDTFAEDPLRVLRAAQFAARFGFAVAEETVALCAALDLSGVAFERVFEEVVKALLKAPRPSVFFETLARMGQLGRWFPEVKALRDVMQEPAYHPEGDVWTHTMQVIDQAALLRDKAQHPLGLMLAALCHDFGKPQATQVIDGRIRAFNHENLGLPLTERFLSRLTTEAKLHKYAANMVALHMRPNALVYMKSGRNAFMKLFDEALVPEDLLLLAKADHMGRGEKGVGYEPLEEKLTQELAAYRERMAQPAVMGADLIAAGMRPGRDMGEALAYAHKLHLKGMSKEQALSQTLAFMREKGKR